MKNIVKLWLNSIIEFTYEIMVEFINLKLIWIHWVSFKSVSVRNKFYSSKVTMTPSLQSAYCRPYGCCAAAARWRGAARLRLQTSGVAAHSRVGRTWRAWCTTLDVTGVEICLAYSRLLVSNEGKYRNLQVERDQPPGHYPDVAIRTSEGFQTEEGRW